MKTEMELHGIDGVLMMLQQMPPEIVSKRGGPVRAALRKAAVVIHKQELANLAAATANATTEERRTTSGLLSKNVVVTRGKEPTGTKGERYIVRVRRKAYPGRDGSPTSTLQSAQLLEYGSSQQPAEPWIRPAFESKAREAIATAEVEIVKAVERAAKKYLKMTKTKAA